MRLGPKVPDKSPSLLANEIVSSFCRRWRRPRSRGDGAVRARGPITSAPINSPHPLLAREARFDALPVHPADGLRQIEAGPPAPGVDESGIGWLAHAGIPLGDAVMPGRGDLIIDAVKSSSREQDVRLNFGQRHELHVRGKGGGSLTFVWLRPVGIPGLAPIGGPFNRRCAASTAPRSSPSRPAPESRRATRPTG